MKLSDIRGERTLDVIADLIDPVTSIAQDPAFQDLVSKKKVPEGTDPRQFFVQRLSKALPQLLRTRKREVIQVLATIKGVTWEEYAESMTLATLFTDAVELLTDEELLDFLPSVVTATE